MTCSRCKRAIDPALEAGGLRLGAGRAPPLLGLCEGASGKELTDERTTGDVRGLRVLAAG